tara:strand:+ start:2143 stop:2742 length:600 start_codon:yes stop_codon:yes gene_type:complete
MASNKTSIYDGSIFLNNTVDHLDLSGWINRKVAVASANAGIKSLRLNADVSSLVSVGDKLMKSLTNELIGTVESIDSNRVNFAGEGTKIHLVENDYVHVYPKFEIVKIDFIGNETYLLKLTPSDRRFVGQDLPDLDTWASNTVNDFGTVSADGVSMYDGAMVIGTSIEGRFKYVMIDCSGLGVDTESAICYLRATPTIM